MHIMIIIISLLMFVSSDTSNADCYSLVDQQELFEIIREDGQNLFKDASPLPGDRMASFYTLSSGKIAVVSLVTNIDSKGAMFNDEACFRGYMDHTLPIPEPNPSFIQETQQAVINSDFEIFVKQYFGAFGIQNAKIDEGFVEQIYNIMIDRLQGGTFVSEDALAFLIVVGELYRNTKGGRWIVALQQGEYNPYYEPLILLPDGKYVNLTFYAFNRLLKQIPFDHQYINNIYNAEYNGQVDSLNREYIIK